MLRSAARSSLRRARLRPRWPRSGVVLNLVCDIGHGLPRHFYFVPPLTCSTDKFADSFDTPAAAEKGLVDAQA